MGKIFFIILLPITICISQNKNHSTKEAKKTLEYIKHGMCNTPFSITANTENLKLNIIANKNNFFLEYIHKDSKHEIRCDGEIIININHKYEEIEIYSLTEKEQKECFLISKFLKETKEIKIENDFPLIENHKILTGKLKNTNLKIQLNLPFKTEVLGRENFEYLIHDDNNIYYGDVLFYKKEEFETKFFDLSLNESFNINSIKENYKEFEIIDFR